MNPTLTISLGLAILSLFSGMLGLGVAFAALPFLSLFLPDLVNQVQPLTLLLNGFTALLSSLGFSKSKNVIWKDALLLSVATTLSAPIGAYFARKVEAKYILIIYFVAVFYLAYNLFRPVKGSGKDRGNLRLAILLAIPISILSGFLGVGPGFLLMPTLILLGYDPKKAAGVNAFAVTPPSFSSLIPHLKEVSIDLRLTLTLTVIGSICSFLGARLTSLYIPSVTLKKIFGVLILIITAYKLYTILF